MNFSWSDRRVRIAAVAAPLLIVVLTICQLYRLNQQISMVRAELDAVHAEISSVKPWAKSRAALAEALSTIPNSQNNSGKPRSSSETTAATAHIENQIGLERRYGRANSLFTLVVYSDLECPFCKEYNAIPKSLVDGSGGNVSLIFKHVPLHKEASRIESLAVECAGEQGGNSAFFNMLDAVFANTHGNGSGVSQPLPSIGESLGLSAPQLRECLDTDRYMPKLSADLDEASRLGIQKTPTTVVRNNRTGKSQIIPGVSTAETLMQAMASLVDQ